MNDSAFIDSHARSARRRWLVVDDEPELSALIADVLAPLNPASIESFTSSPEALAAFSANPSRFDLVVTDRDMPGLDGMELASRLCARAPGVKIILVSAHIDDLSAEALRRAGVHAVVRKPFTLAQLEAIIRHTTRAHCGSISRNTAPILARAA